MNKFEFSKKLVGAITISIAVGLVLGLSSSVSALRRIDNRVDINAPAIPLGESGTSSASSGDYVFEKGDAIYRDFDLTPYLIPNYFDFESPWTKFLLTLWAHMGHCGLYSYWEPDENNDPTIKENHKTIESYLNRYPLIIPSYIFGEAGVHDDYDFQYFVDSVSMIPGADDIWGVRTSDKLTADKRLKIIDTATDQLDCKYHFFWGYKRPGVSFRDDGLVEYCYEIAFGDEWKPGKNGGIVKNDFWLPRRGCRVLYPRRQFNYLTAQDNTCFPTLIFGKLEGEVMREPIWIEGVEIHPEDGRYEVYGDEVEVNIHASDIDFDNDGSGITRLELWVGEMDDTPDEMPGLRLLRDDTNYPADNDYTYIWDTTEKEDGEPLFPNGDYTLKTIGFDQAGNKAENEIQVEVANGGGKYLYVRVEPSYVETDGSNNDRTGAFDVYVEVWDFGKCLEEGCLPEGCKPKKEGTQSWYYDGVEGKYKQEVCCTNFEVEPTQDVEISGTVVLSPLHPDVNPDSESSGLWKNGWDGAITITDGVGSVSNVRYRDKDGNSINGRHMVFLVGADMAGAKGNDLLMINPVWVSAEGVRYRSRGGAGEAKKPWDPDSTAAELVWEAWTNAKKAWAEAEWSNWSDRWSHAVFGTAYGYGTVAGVGNWRARCGCGRCGIEWSAGRLDVQAVSAAFVLQSGNSWRHWVGYAGTGGPGGGHGYDVWLHSPELNCSVNAKECYEYYSLGSAMSHLGPEKFEMTIQMAHEDPRPFIPKGIYEALGGYENNECLAAINGTSHYDHFCAVWMVYIPAEVE